MHMKSSRILAKANETRPHAGGWKHKLAAIIRSHNFAKAGGRGTTSFRTRDGRTELLFSAFTTLRGLGYKIEEPTRLKPKHVEALVKLWIDQGLQISTIDKKLSVLRVFCTWLGKRDIVKSLHEYVPGASRTYAAEQDKSWSAHGIDFWEIWDKASKLNEYVAMQLLLIAAFGARKEEALMFRPLACSRAGGLYIELFDGTKGGRPRTVPVDDLFKVQVLATLKHFVLSRYTTPNAHIGNPSKTLEQNERTYYYVLERCGITKGDLGVTGHGLRAEYANDELEKRGVVTSVRGGSGRERKSGQVAIDIAYLQVSEAMGHSRKSIMTAYTGRLAKTSLIKGGEARSLRANWKHEASRRLDACGALPVQ